LLVQFIDPVVPLLGYNQEFTLIDRNSLIAVGHPQGALNPIEELIFLRMVVPDERPFELSQQLYLLLVQFD
jgi:hypothetical protein